MALVAVHKYVMLIALFQCVNSWAPPLFSSRMKYLVKEEGGRSSMAANAAVNSQQPFWRRKHHHHMAKLFGEEVINKYPYDRDQFKTPQQETAYLLNNTVEMDNSLLPEIDLDAELREQKAKRTFIGEMHGLDDPRDVKWRLKAENIIRNCIKEEGKVSVYDITWNMADLNVVIEPLDKNPPLDLDTIEATSKAIEAALTHFEVRSYVVDGDSRI
jgi:hypothetical protein